ncbi:MAG: hypothetical protein HUU54_03735 [Ignavibacteriaceae bacterium]|nr:hypothetical protein [Ignavibacteriaceae bacterium]
MGTQVLLDIMGSMFIGGVLILTLQRVNQETVAQFYYYSSDFILQRSLIDMVEILENDLKRIGYTANPMLIPTPTEAIRAADTSSIRFVGDVDADGTVDTINYSISATSAVANTKNPRDRILYKRINSGSQFIISANVTRFRFDYFNALGQSIATPIPSNETGEIATIQLSVEVESPDAFDDNYAQAYWRQVRLAAKNLRNR